MCTAICLKEKDCYFGRNLDLEYSYNETVTITPRNYCFKFRKKEEIKTHYAIIGMAYVVDDYPLYYDAFNEKGLAMAGLNFPENADYKDEAKDKNNITPFEFIPWILCRCKNVDEAEKEIENMNMLNENFSEELPLSPLHWIVSDKERSVVVECVKEGIKLYENPVGVLTNNPTFEYMMTNLNNYMALSAKDTENRFSQELDLKPYSRGMGALGLPGDFSSVSRFVKASFIKMNSASGENEEDRAGQFFHILDSVAQIRGSVHVGSKYEITVYSSCCNLDKGIYYYTTYQNRQISAVDMYKENLNGEKLISYGLKIKENICFQN